MKQYLSALFCMLLFHANAQETYDRIFYKAPASWIKETGRDYNKYSILDPNSGDHARILIYQSVAGSGNTIADFKADWEELVVRQFEVGKPSEEIDQPLSENWTAHIGETNFTFNKRLYNVTLFTARNGNIKVSIITLSNNDKYQKVLLDFYSSVSFKPTVPNEAPVIVSQSSDFDQRLIGKWNRSGSITPTYANPASWGNSGYTKSRYQFNSDGTYRFTERSFRYSLNHIIIVEETGRFIAKNDQLTVIPAKSNIKSYSKKNGTDELGALLNSIDRELEKITYTFRLHYFSGIQEWNLVLQHDIPTKREGAFSTLTVYPNAWYFDQRFITKDLTDPK